MYENAKTLGKTYHFENWFDDAIKLDYVDIIQVGELMVEPGYEVEEHTQICNEISYVVSGSCTFYTNGKPLKASQGDIHIVSAGSTHAIVADKNEPLRYTYIGFQFNGNAPNCGVEELIKFYDHQITYLLNDKNQTRMMFSLLLSEIYARLIYDKIMIGAYVDQLLIHTYRIYRMKGVENYHRSVDEAKAKRIVGYTIYSVIRYIDQNIFRIKSIKDMAEELGYSPSYLSHLFRAKMGITLQQYINHKKFEASVELLRDDKYSITQITSDLNYGTIQSFCKMFRKTAGCSPTEYRKRNLK